MRLPYHTHRTIAIAFACLMICLAILPVNSRRTQASASVLLRDPVNPQYRPWIGRSVSELAGIGRRTISQPDSFPTAIKAYTTILGLYDAGLYEEKDIRDIVSAFNNLGYIYTFHYLDYQKGIRYLNQGLELAEKKGVKERIPVICLNLGAIYSFNQLQFSGISFPEKTLNIYYKGLEAALKVNDVTNYMKLFNNVLNVAVTIQYHELPKTIFEDFHRVPKSKEDNLMFPFTEKHIEAYNSILAKDYMKALSIYSDMEDMTSGFQDATRYKLMAISEKVALQELMKDYSSAAKELERGLDIAGINGYDDITLTFLNDARRLYSNLGETDKADRYYIDYLKQKDSILNACSMKAVSEIEFHNEIDRMENTVRDLSYHKKIQYMWIWILGIFSFLAILFIVYYFYTNRRLRQQNRTLYQKTLSAIRTEDLNFELRKENEALRARAADRSSEEGEATSSDKKNKYSYSQLDEERKERIRQKIETVIEEDRDVFRQDFSLGTLAEKVGCPQTYLSQVMSEKIGKNFYTLLSERRIKEACLLMSDPANANLSIEGIASEVGIRSRSNFTSLFKKFTGLTPAQFARQTRAE